MFQNLRAIATRVAASKLTRVGVITGVLYLGATLASNFVTETTERVGELDELQKRGMDAVESLNQELARLEARRQELEHSVSVLASLQKSFAPEPSEPGDPWHAATSENQD